MLTTIYIKIGYLSKALNDAVKNPVVFAAFRDKAFSNSLYVTGDIGYNVIETNFGNGLNPTYGIFKAPKSGFMNFTFLVKPVIKVMAASHLSKCCSIVTINFTSGIVVLEMV